MANELMIHGKTTATSLALPKSITDEEWLDLGVSLGKFERSKMWWVGDWLRHKYPDGDADYNDLEDKTSLEHGTMKQALYVCRNVPASNRFDALGFLHHAIVAPLPEAQQKKWLEKAVKDDLTVRQLREAIRGGKTPALPNGKYRVIYADPPWEVGSIVLDKWESPLSDKYPTMNTGEIMALNVADLRCDDCSLFLWTTHTFLHEAFHVIEAWGFKYHVCLTWDKGGGWTSNGFHRRTELCLYAYSGKMNIPSDGGAIPTLISEAKREHSRKPDVLYELIESRIPEPRIELFARNKRAGWDVWGNQI